MSCIHTLDTITFYSLLFECLFFLYNLHKQVFPENRTVKQQQQKQQKENSDIILFTRTYQQDYF